MVWLPLQNDINNKGTYNIGTSSTGATLDANGKIGKCYKFNSASNNQIIYSLPSDLLNNHINNHSFSACCWVKTTEDRSWLHITYGIRFFVNSFQLYRSGNQTSCSSTVSSTDGKWHHIACTYNIKNNELKFYRDGINTGSSNYTYANSYASSWTNNINVGRDPNNNLQSYFFEGCLNDLRIYDECLSPKEIKEISKGLVLHYPLNDEFSESTVNKFTQPVKRNDYINSYCPDGIQVSGWAVGYNGGVSDPTHGTHAYWKMIDNIPTMVFPDINSSINQTHRWLGISGGGLSASDFTNGRKYTVSFDAKADVNNKQITCGLYHVRTGQSGNSFWDGCPATTLTKEWQRYSITYTSGGCSSLSAFYFYGHYGAEGTAYVRNIQLEFNDHATPYTYNSRDGIVYDTSGYENNGIIDGNISFSSDTPRNNQCILNTSQIYIKSNLELSELSNLTCSFWVKLSQWGTQTSGLIATSNLNTPSDYSTTTFNHRDGGFDLRGTNGTTYRLTCNDSNIPLNQWKHVVITHDSQKARLYINGDFIRDVSIPSSLVGFKSLFLCCSYAGGLNRRCLGNWSDLRFYTTTLNDSEIKELYNISASIDNEGNILSYEFEENEKSSITKQGQVISKSISEYIEHDGALWIPIMVHDVKNGINMFSSSDKFSDGLVYKNHLCWADFNLISTESRPESGYYEFLVIQEDGTNRVLNQYRWKQTVSPLTATWEDVNPNTIGSKVIRISSTTTNNYAGMYKMNSNEYMCFANTSKGNWYGCGVWSLWGGTAGTNGYIPGYNGVQIYGLQMLYMRVTSCIVKQYNEMIITNNLIET